MWIEPNGRDFSQNGNLSFSWQAQADAHGGWRAPLEFAADTLTNNELGWKSRWLEQRIQFNGAMLQEDWNHVQTAAFDPEVIGGAVTALNGGEYRVRGLEVSLLGRITAGLTIDASDDWTHSELVREAAFSWADGTLIDFSNLQLRGGRKLTNPLGTRRSSLVGAPPFHGKLRARYEFAWNDVELSAQVGAIHQAHSYTSTDPLTQDLQGNSTNYELPPWTTFDASFGISKDNWMLEAYGENLTDARAELYANYRQYYKAVTVNRPRTLGLRFAYRTQSPR